MVAENEKWWEEEPTPEDKARSALTAKVNVVTPMILRQFQELVSILVTLQESQGLVDLLGCVQGVFRQGDDAMSKGVKMGISSEVVPDGWN